MPIGSSLPKRESSYSDFIQDGIDDGRDQAWRDFDSVNLFQVSLNLPLCHPARVQRNNLLIEAVKARLVLLDQLRFKVRVAVTRNINLDLPAFTTHRLWRDPIARVAGVVTGSVMLLIAEMMGQLTIKGTFDESLS